MENELPMENKTAEFINGQNYIFSAYVRQNKIIRQFVKNHNFYPYS